MMNGSVVVVVVDDVVDVVVDGGWQSIPRGCLLPPLLLPLHHA